ncbi:MAG TPA: glycosyltransferase family 2 protein [Steroidobacteraceae bacterium]|nr:glycosyltransferase family 2 protein [Steroidobacteraceae bacterium]
MSASSTLVLAWCLLGAIAAAIYPIVGYPLVLALIGMVRNRPVRRGRFRPSVSVLIPAYNEAGCIGATIENKLGQDYPADRLEILVISDASEDGTDAIVAGYADRGVKLLRREKREGKAAALNEAVSRAAGEIMVFSDANSTFATDTISRLMENFADPRIGYVTGNLEYGHDGELSGRGSGAYMRYENWLRRLESRVDSVIGVNGGVDAMRRELYRPVPASQITDFVLPLRVVAAGMRVIFDERACSREAANTELGAEFRMRVRVALRALHGLVHVRAALNPFRRPLPAFCILSHKVLRYLSFVFLALALALNAALAGHSPALAALLACQVVFYALALAGLSRRLPNAVRKLTALPTYFVLSNVAFGIAALRFARGETMATWKPRAG